MSSPVTRKVIDLDFLQRKVNLFINQRPQPVFKIKLDGTRYGQGTLTVFLIDPNVEGGYNIATTSEFKRDDLDIPITDPFDHHFYFADLNSSGFTLNIIPEIEAVLHFETEGPQEIHINHLSDVDLRRFNISIKFQFALDNDNNVLVTQPDWIKADVSIDSIPGYREYVEGRIASTVKAKVYGALFDVPKDIFSLRSSGKIVGPSTSLRQLAQTHHLSAPVSLRELMNALGVVGESSSRARSVMQGLNTELKKWFLGGDFHVADVVNDGHNLMIDYIIPPGQLEPFPEHPQPPLDPGPLLAHIDHIVVLMMENRSFDHMLGYLSKEGGRSDIDGLHGGETNSDASGKSYPSFRLPNTVFKDSPDHGHEAVEKQIKSTPDDRFMDGFVKSFVEKYPNTDNPRLIMGYYTADQVPVYDGLAKGFLICQRWFAAHPGPTFCNRFYTVTGRLNRNSSGEFEQNNFKGDAFKPVTTKTLFDHLTEHGVSWHYYEQRYCFLRLFERYTFDDTYIVDANDAAKGFFASAHAGTLPSVSFIDPNFIDEPDGEDNDDGAPANITAGQNLIGRVVNAVMHGPKWQQTLLIITYDEHGGFYDHVNPLDFKDKAKPVSDIDHYGVRVPTFVISPWVDAQAVSNIVFDHTSIAKTIARRFMSTLPPDMGERMAAANDLSMVLRPTARQDKPNIPVPPAPAPHAALAKQAAPVAESDDFKEVLRTMRARYPIPR